MDDECVEDFRLITVKKKKKRSAHDSLIEIYNPTQYVLLGSGAQGAVFKLDDKRCVKVYDPSENNIMFESKALKAAQGIPYFPAIYETGPNYIVMEYIEGQDLKKYLAKTRSLSDNIVYQIVQIIKEMKRLGFTRIKIRLMHIYIKENGQLKILDHANVYRTYEPYPISFFQELKKLGLLEDFLQKVKNIEPSMLKEWTKAINFDRL